MMDFGGATGGGIETSLGMWGGSRVTGSVKGFWANVETNDRQTCSRADCFVFDPAGEAFAFGPPILSHQTSRDADYWGGPGRVEIRPAGAGQMRSRISTATTISSSASTFAASTRTTASAASSTANRSSPTRRALDTTYYGGYIGFGGEYSFGFIPGVKNVGGLYDRLGLRTFINVTAGLYYANTDYDGHFAFDFFALRRPSSKICPSRATISPLSAPSRSRPASRSALRTSLSLWTDYEYISSVPEMRYAEVRAAPTRIGDDDAFATRTMLRLNIGLGSQQLYPEPMK